MQTSLQNQGQAAQGIQAGATSLQNQAGQLNAALPATMTGIQGAITSGGNQQGTTGVNQNAVGQQAINYDTNTSATNLSQANPALSSFYNSEMTGGLNQQTQLNAQNQLQQQEGQNVANLNNSAAPGVNQNNLKQQMQNSELTQSTNLAGSLAGQNQTTMQQGAQGVASTAGGLDTQTMNMLQSALTGSSGLNTSSLTNLLSVLGLGTSAATAGTTATNDSNSALGGLFSGYGTQATDFGAQAQQNEQATGLSFGQLIGGIGSAAGSAAKAGA
jgi:hypothetical protein